MNSSLYIGATGMKGLADGMQVTSNNLANVSTIGFKQQNILFSDVMYQTQGAMGGWWNAQEASTVGVGQVGQGLQIEAIRTKFSQGALESTNTMTDLAISGKGFFQVSDGENTYYTRAGDFRSDNEGVWRTPSGLALNGFKLGANGEREELGQIRIDPQYTLPAQATTTLSLTMNLASSENHTINSENPFFGLLEAYDASKGTPLGSDAYSSSQSMIVYDAEGNSHTVTAYFDAAPVSGSNNRFMEFVLAGEQSYDVDADGNLITPEAGSGLLMSGVLEFDTSGNLVNVSAFTPGEAGDKDLANWKSADLSNGNPVFNLNGNEMGINFGISAAEGYQGNSVTAAQIGADAGLLPGMGEEISRSEFPTTAYATSSMTNSYKQDGYAEGVLSNVSISSDGIVMGHFSNSQNVALYEIPVCRFTSEDGLRREGGNLFSATAEAGVMEMGTPGTENYGEVMAYNIETSNVDMATEMVNMIITQRGFQSNSKVVTTADQLLQKAMELKRS